MYQTKEESFIGISNHQKYTYDAAEEREDPRKELVPTPVKNVFGVLAKKLSAAPS